MLVHVLKNGFALCGAGAPDTWPEGVKWISFQDHQHKASVTCRSCYHIMDGLKSLDDQFKPLFTALSSPPTFKNR